MEIGRQCRESPYSTHPVSCHQHLTLARCLSQRSSLTKVHTRFLSVYPWAFVSVPGSWLGYGTTFSRPGRLDSSRLWHFSLLVMTDSFGKYYLGTFGMFPKWGTGVGALCSREAESGSFPFPQCGPEGNSNSHPQTAPSSELRGVTQEKVVTCWFKTETTAS